MAIVRIRQFLVNYKLSICRTISMLNRILFNNKVQKSIDVI